MRILLAPDKFRQTLTQGQVAAAMAEGVTQAFQDAEVRSLAMADGGEGTVSVLVPDHQLHVTVSVVGPLGAPQNATCARTPEGVGYVEMALCSGLSLVSDDDRRDPLRASSVGTGQAIVEMGRLCSQVRVGVGGSASTDGGTGAARVAGYRFFDKRGGDLPEGGGHLGELASIGVPRTGRAPVVGLCDVLVSLTGPDGAAHGFASQKGASTEEVLKLEEGLVNLTAVIERDLGVAVGSLPGGGAGGGMGAGLAAFFGATLVSGAAAVADEIGLDAAITSADLVITGEGRLDRGTFGNKVVAEVARRAVQLGVPVIAVCGQVDRTIDPAALGLKQAFSVEELSGGAPVNEPGARLAEAIATALKGLPPG